MNPILTEISNSIKKLDQKIQIIAPDTDPYAHENSIVLEVSGRTITAHLMPEVLWEYSNCDEAFKETVIHRILDAITKADGREVIVTSVDNNDKNHQS